MNPEIHKTKNPRLKQPSEEDKKVIDRALFIKRRGDEIKGSLKNEWEKIIRQRDNAFSTTGADGARWMYTKLPFVAEKKVREKLVTPKWDVEFVDGADNKMKELTAARIEAITTGESAIETDRKLKKLEELRRLKLAILKAGVEYVMRKGGWERALLAKDGAYNRMVSLGDAFISVEAGESEEAPIRYTVRSPDSIYVNPQALQFRGSAMGKNVDRILMMTTFTWDQYVEEFVKEMFPEEEWEEAKNIRWGLFPDEHADDKELNQTSQEKSATEHENRGQLGVFIDLQKKAVYYMAGTDMTVVKKLDGIDFPYFDLSSKDYKKLLQLRESGSEKEKEEFTKKQKVFAPIVHLICFPSLSGFYNKGMGHYSYEAGVVNQTRINKVISGALKEVDPITIITAETGARDEIELSIQDAMDSVADGYPGILVNEISPNGMPKIGKVDKLHGGSMADAGIPIEGVEDKLYTQLGMNMFDVNTEKGKSATAIMEESSSQTALPQQIIETNIPEFEFVVDLTFKMIRELVDEDNDTPIPSAEIQIFGEESGVSVSGITLGMVAKILKEEGDVIVMVDANSGVAPSSLEKTARLTQLISLSQGTDMLPVLLQEMYSLDNRHVPIESVTPRAPDGAQQNGQITSQQIDPKLV